MQVNYLKEIVIAALEEIKGQNIKILDVTNQTDIADYMIISSGTSHRQVRALANEIVEKCKAAGCSFVSVEGEQHGEWVLVDTGAIITHIMLPEVRDFYCLEKLWDNSLPTEAENIS
ncbi:ribosome silencing factor [Candidatus Nitrosacidococcus sp. I8]|uniref:ribosome silencing factor n=1 Tax=Candidatus Nitrosacidococcus sp. I8 TaxID=2942908 RepID=UPI0022268A26|nr:ribosome silencing factor [Candidatus Nitrosacidococcus sp. I8]CAH9019470.1 Ribosomal silencing factor RsfS [Candidatus Nitrosacidococcus sp. I8]